ncbi:MAG: anti-sigma factor [bacterium]
MSELKRYQNPEVFERLAMDYAIGLMRGRARQRFETLMQRHLYLRAVTQAYEQYFAGLNECLPEQQPSEKVWQAIEQQLDLEKTSLHKMSQKTPSAPSPKKSTGLFAWWHTLGAQTAGFVASLALLFGIGFSLVNSGSVSAYVAMMESTDTQRPTIMATVKKGEGVYLHFIQQGSQQTTIPQGMTLRLWCIPKEGGVPMMMGDVSTHDDQVVKLDQAGWNDLRNVGRLAISLEPMQTKESTPQGDILYQGKLMIMSDND